MWHLELEVSHGDKKSTVKAKVLEKLDGGREFVHE